VEVKTRKLFRELIKKLALEILDEEDLEEITVTGDVAGYSTPRAFGKKRKQKKIGVNEALNEKDLKQIVKLIRNVVGDIYRDIWLKRNAWK
tara:strand:- start:44 stop:316 length:273 start_codon:yes stop_codon:yes gene_type:complete